MSSDDTPPPSKETPHTCRFVQTSAGDAEEEEVNHTVYHTYSAAVSGTIPLITAWRFVLAATYGCVLRGQQLWSEVGGRPASLVERACLLEIRQTKKTEALR